jgi:hypothetical protein
MSYTTTLPDPPTGAAHIDGFPGYAVSRDGRVWNIRCPGKWQPRYRFDWAEMKQYRRPCYLSVTLWRNNAPSHIYVHKLVLTHFVSPRPTPRHEACHLDGNPLNNRLDNLRWAEHRENESHKRAHGTAPTGERNGTAILSADTVRLIRAATGTQRAIAERFGIAQPTVCNVRKRKTWTHVT